MPPQIVVRRRSQSSYSPPRHELRTGTVLFTMADVEAQYANFGPMEDAKRQADTFMRKTKRGGVSIVRKGKRLARRAKSVVIGDTWLGTGVRAAGLGAAILARRPILGVGRRAGLLALGAGRRAGEAASDAAGRQYRQTLQAGARTSRDIGRAATDAPSRVAAALDDMGARVRGMGGAPAPRSAPRMVQID